MSKKKKVRGGTLQREVPSPGREESPHDTAQRNRNIRETVESIAIAFILAFLFRTFEAEAFVIPTGSMAPTLQGLHKDIHCAKCGYRYQSSASSEDDGDVKRWRAEVSRQGQTAELRREIASKDVVMTTCPMCRYSMPVDPNPGPEALSDPKVTLDARQPSYNGDRILVGKFIYEFNDPRRWDIVVFKYPGDAKMNYIKRLVGLPNEELRIWAGDIYTRPPEGDAPFRIERKPPDKVWSMRHPVHDNDFNSSDLYRRGWPLRWQAWPSNATDNAWISHVDAESGPSLKQTFTIDGNSPQAHWIRYQHLVPDYYDWQELLLRGSLPADRVVRPQLITDFYAYNAYLTRKDAQFMDDRDRAQKHGLHWVGDLALQCEVEVRSSQGEVLLDLVEAGTHFQCAIDVATGVATVSTDDRRVDLATASGDTAVRGPGTYQLTFANVDSQIFLWVDGVLVSFDSATSYHRNGSLRPVSTPSDAGDLAPAGAGSRGAALTIVGLRVFRDIYYIADRPNTTIRRPISDYNESEAPLENLTLQRLVDFLSDPSRWSVFDQRRYVQFSIGSDKFFVLGDNSPFSKDGRLWADEAPDNFVDRRLLIGKALCIYWPHSWDRVPGTNIPFPYFPNFADMGFVR